MSTNRFKNDSQDVAEFLSKPRGDTLSRLQQLKAALERPDALVEDTPPSATEARDPAPVSAEPSAVTTLPVPAQRQEPPAPQQSAVRTSELPAPANGGVEIPAREPNKGGRPLLGSRPKVEKTFAIDEDIHQRLIEISNWEGIRHRKKFSVSHMMNHALMFAIAHMEGTNMIPIDGKDGLVIPMKPTKEQSQ